MTETAGRAKAARPKLDQTKDKEEKNAEAEDLPGLLLPSGPLPTEESPGVLVVCLADQSWSLQVPGASPATFFYDDESMPILMDIQRNLIPAPIIDILESGKPSCFSKGHVLAEIRDYRVCGLLAPPAEQTSVNPTVARVWLRPSGRSRVADLHLMRRSTRRGRDRGWTMSETITAERKVLHANKPRLLLDPSPTVLHLAAAEHRRATSWLPPGSARVMRAPRGPPCRLAEAIARLRGSDVDNSTRRERVVLPLASTMPKAAPQLGGLPPPPHTETVTFAVQGSEVRAAVCHEGPAIGTAVYPQNVLEISPHPDEASGDGGWLVQWRGETDDPARTPRAPCGSRPQAVALVAELARLCQRYEGRSVRATRVSSPTRAWQPRPARAHSPLPASADPPPVVALMQSLADSEGAGLV
eukprot:m.90895 g.90895  ORF g.90895 m.90895 type:complete len:414 (+) comp13711_c0_seq3:180-1421(+)